MSFQQLAIDASFCPNGTCSYTVLLNGQQVDHNIIGIVTNWAELLRVIYQNSPSWVSKAQKPE